MKTEPDHVPVPAVTPSDWAVLRHSRPEDYDGHTGFERMTPAARLAWLETAVEFVSQHAKRPPVTPTES